MNGKRPDAGNIEAVFQSVEEIACPQPLLISA